MGGKFGITTKGRGVSVAHVVHENENDIGCFFGCRECGDGVEFGQCSEQEAGESWHGG